MRLFGLIGYPLTHSFSKKYFDHKFEQEGLTDCMFENFPIPTINDLTKLLIDHPNLGGLAVTIPYKQEVLQFLHRNAIPQGLSACNCIRINDGKLTGYNTDHIGFEKSFKPLLKPYHTKALVLGNGGATAAVVFVLKKLGIEYRIVSRKLHNGSTLTYDDLDEQIIKTHKVIVNTTPLGMYPQVTGFPAIPYSFITSEHLCYDLVYNPARTRFMENSERQGAVTKNGSDMLIIQAEENWLIWNDNIDESE